MKLKPIDLVSFAQATELQDTYIYVEQCRDRMHNHANVLVSHDTFTSRTQTFLSLRVRMCVYLLMSTPNTI